MRVRMTSPAAQSATKSVSIENITRVFEEPFGRMPDGREVELYTLKTPSLKVLLTNFGARIVSVEAPDRTGKPAHVVLGLNTLDEYVADRNTYLGAIVGRYGNRIAQGRFSLGNETYQVPANDNGNALHGGPEGFDRGVWQGRIVDEGVEMSMLSPDGDQGFPGALRVIVRYTLQGGALAMDYTASTDKDTVVNLTNHAYFNLAGESSGSILEHEVMIPAASYTPTDANLIPTGELAPVEGTPFDFRHATVIGDRVDADHVQLQLAGGYDHNWVLGGADGAMKLAAQVRDRASGRVLTVETTEPGIQFYSGNFLKGTLANRTGGTYARRTGFCLETQHFPDSPNHPEFPTTVLKAGTTMQSRTVFSFSVEG
jgi:aldose 1-epimerase